MNVLHLLCFLLTIIGLVFSPPLLSIGLIGMLLVSAWEEPKVLGRRLKSPVFWAFASLYLVMFWGAWQTYDWGYFVERLRIKSPLLLVPLAWPNRKVDLQLLRQLLVIFTSVVLVGVLVNYALDFEAITERIGQGKAVPVPRGNHIRFSLLVALSALISIGLYRVEKRKVWLLIAGFLFLSLHLLAVRSGLLGAYAGAGVLLMANAWASGRWKWAVVGLAGLVLLPVVAYFAVPSFKKKFDYARYELLHRNPAEDDHTYSDNLRFRTISQGLELWRENPWLGVGYGNLRAEMPEEHRPHNQFVSAGAAGGVVGFLVTLGAMVYLLWSGIFAHRVTQREHRVTQSWEQPVFVAVWSVLFLSCLFENTLETSVGVTLFTVVLSFYTSDRLLTD